MILNHLIWIFTVVGGLTFYSCSNSADNNTEEPQLIENSELNAELDNVNVEPIVVDTSIMTVTALPRPNSMRYSYAEAENKKSDIYKLCPTFKYLEWENPTTGGAVHINQQGELIVYNATFPNFDSTDTFVPDSIDLGNYVGGIGFGNPASVLITSEINPENSRAMDKILEDLFEPGTQLYYLKRRTKP